MKVNWKKGPTSAENFGGSGIASETVQPLLLYIYLTLIQGQEKWQRTISVIQFEFILGPTGSNWSAVEDHSVTVEQ